MKNVKLYIDQLNRAHEADQKALTRLQEYSAYLIEKLGVKIQQHHMGKEVARIDPGKLARKFSIVAISFDGRPGLAPVWLQWKPGTESQDDRFDMVGRIPVIKESAWRDIVNEIER